MFFSDQPITNSKEDLLGRSGFANILAHSLVNLKMTDTFTVGLFGKWGCGKTSIVNMMLQEMERLQQDVEADRQIIVVHFEPWNFSTTDQLLSQFFVRLSNVIKSKKDKNLSNIADAIENYSDALDLFQLLPTFGGPLSFVGKAGSKALVQKLKNGDDKRDVQKQKEYIIKLLNQQSKRILVVIDDIDRLSNEHIRQVFQLIASVAKFPNTMYLLVFDKSIVVEALKNVQEGNGEDYLEKIIQMPIQIPDISKDRLRAALIANLNSILNSYDCISFQKSRWERLFHQCIDPLVENLRDVNRLCNSVQFKLTTIASEVDFVDMVALSALEIALPQVYEWIKTHKSILTGSIDYSSFRLHEKPQAELYSQYYTEIETLLTGNSKKAMTAMNALSYLFPHFGRLVGKNFEVNDANQSRRGNYISHPDKFDRYFNLDLEDKELRKSEISTALNNLNEREFKTYLLALDAEGKSYSFLQEVNATVSELPPERAKLIIRVLFQICARLDSTNKDFLSFGVSTYAEFLIVDLLKNFDLQQKMELLTEAISCSTLYTMSTVATILNKIELGYGRFAAKGKETAEYKIIPLDNLIQLENAFIQKAETMLETNSLFDFVYWERIGFLLECYDPEFLKQYYAEAFHDSKNIAMYCASSVSEWTGSGTEYEVKDDYKKYLTDHQIMQAIESLRISGDLFSLPSIVQNKCAAFSLFFEGMKNYHGNISLAEVNDLLQAWHNPAAS